MEKNRSKTIHPTAVTAGNPKKRLMTTILLAPPDEREAASSVSADSPLASEVHRVLAVHPHLGGRRVRCETQEDRVILRGTVESFFQKQLAQEALRRIDGVGQIDNRLEVDWSLSRSNA